MDDYVQLLVPTENKTVNMICDHAYNAIYERDVEKFQKLKRTTPISALKQALEMECRIRNKKRDITRMSLIQFAEQKAKKVPSKPLSSCANWINILASLGLGVAYPIITVQNKNTTKDFITLSNNTLNEFTRHNCSRYFNTGVGRGPVCYNTSKNWQELSFLGNPFENTIVYLLFTVTFAYMVTTALAATKLRFNLDGNSAHGRSCKIYEICKKIVKEKKS